MNLIERLSAITPGDIVLFGFALLVSLICAGIGGYLYYQDLIKTKEYKDMLKKTEGR